MRSERRRRRIGSGLTLQLVVCVLLLTLPTAVGRAQDSSLDDILGGFDDEEAQDESGEARNCRRCLYLGDQYEKDASFWVGEDGLLERYQWRQDASRLWDVALSRDD